MSSPQVDIIKSLDARLERAVEAFTRLERRAVHMVVRLHEGVSLQELDFRASLMFFA